MKYDNTLILYKYKVWGGKTSRTCIYGSLFALAKKQRFFLGKETLDLTQYISANKSLHKKRIMNECKFNTESIERFE
jgi:hypothetical protein